MARPLRLEFPGGVYLVTARTRPRVRLGHTDEDMARLAARIPDLARAHGAVVHAYCFLPDHYHLLVETPRANLARVVHRLNAGIAASRRTRSGGALFRGRYRALVIEPDTWLVPLSVHVHLNPVRRKRADDPWSYPGSSAAAYAGRPLEGVRTERVLELAGGPRAYRDRVEAARTRPPRRPWREAWQGVALGGPEFVGRIRSMLSGRDLREVPGFGRRGEGPGMDEVVGHVAAFTGLTPEEIVRGKYQRVLARRAAMYLARRCTDLTLRQIGEAFGVDYTAVHMAVRRLEERRRHDPALEAFLAELEASFRSGPAREEHGRPASRARRRRRGTGPGRGGQMSLFGEDVP